MRNGVRCVLFDLDGTLIDSAPDLAMAADEMRTARGLPSIPLATYRPHAGAGARGMLGMAFGIKPGDADFEALREEFLQRYERRMTCLTRAFDGVPELLSALQARSIHWGVVTNKATRLTHPLIATWPWFDTCRVVVCGDTTPFSKPHPAPVLEALQVAGLKARDTVYVGDDERDMRAGRAAGVATVAARYGYLGEGADVSAWPADAVIDRPLALLNWLPSA